LQRDLRGIAAAPESEAGAGFGYNRALTRPHQEARPMMPLHRLCVLALALLMAPLALGQAAAGTLEQLFTDYDEAFVKLNPHEATRRGDRRYNGVLIDGISQHYLDAERHLAREFMTRLDAIERNALSQQQQVSADTFRFNLQFMLDRQASGFAARDAQMPLNQLKGLHLELAQFGSGSSLQPFASAEDHELWLQRAAQWPLWVDQAIANMRAGMESGVVLPRILAERVLPQLEAHLLEDPEQSVFWGPMKHLDNDADRARFDPRYRELISQSIVPGYRALRDFLRDEYLPATRATVARSALPEGAAWYAMDIRANTTLALSAEQIHQTGLVEVARLQREMDQVREQIGFEGDLRAFYEHLRSSEEYLFASEEAALAAYSGMKDKVRDRLPALFGRVPRADYEVRPVEAFRAASAASGSYQRADAAGTRPGVFYLNTSDLTRIPNFETTSLSLHEASPGHHFQISLASESETLPGFQRFGSITAYTEGWALYAETLANEMDLFDDPLQYLGFLHSRLFRANRLVVDTGLHAFGWSRERAIQQFLDNSPLAVADASAEVERYIAWPGQALAYLTGALEIQRLREEAAARLGEHFDLRAFHDEVLADGIVPLPVLQTKIERWIEQRADTSG